MKSSSFKSQWLILSVLLSHLTTTVSASFINSTEHWMNSTWHGVENKTESTFDDWKEDIEDDIDKAKELFEKAIANEVVDYLDEKKGVLAQFSMGYNEVPPVSGALKKSKVGSEVTVGLYDPDGDYPQPPEFDFLQSQYSGYDEAWFGIALDSFDTVFELEIDLAASASASGENFTLSLLKIPASYDGVTVEVDFQVVLTAAAAVEMSFVVGLELAMSKPAAIIMPALDPILSLNESRAIGFKPEDFTLKPIFNASVPKLEFDLTLSLRTLFSISVESYDVGSIWLDLPAFDFSVKTLNNKLANCKNPAPGTPADKIYAELIQLEGSLDAVLSYEMLDSEFSGVLDSWQIWNFLDECYAFLPGVGSLGPVPPTSNDAVLTATPLTTCTTEGRTTGTLQGMISSLTPGEKAGIALGVIIGIALIAALAFFAGRWSHAHSLKKHGMQSLPVSEMENAPDGFLTVSNMQAPNSDGRWRKMKKITFSPLPQTNTSSQAELMRDSDEGAASPYTMAGGNGNGSGDMGSPEIRVTEYQGHRMGDVEGERLLQEQERYSAPG